MHHKRAMKEGLAPAEAAARWLARLHSDEVTDADRAAFEEWRAASPRHAAAFEEAQAAWEVFAVADADPHVRALGQAALAARPERPRLTLWAVAASLVLVAGVGLQIASRLPTGTDLASLERLGVPDYITEKGERRSVRLPDGTSVTLNTDTRIDVAYGPAARLVTMSGGQAFFDVAKDPDRPFIVNAGGQRITALGTAFDVRLEGGIFEVLLVEGEIAVEHDVKGHDVKGDGLKGDAQTVAAPLPLVMTAGQELIVSAGAIEHNVVEDIDRVLRWRDGFVEFQDENLAAAVAEFNRYAVHPILIKDPRVAALRVTGVFRTDRPEHFVEAMGELHPIAVDSRKTGETVLLWAGG